MLRHGRNHRAGRPSMGGATLVEVLVALVISTLGLLTLAGLQARMNMAVLESYQRAQAMTLLRDMAHRIDANPGRAADYPVAAPVGVGDSAPTDCSTLANPTRAALDLCEWSNALKGAAAQRGTSAVGAMVDGRGCIETVRSADTQAGVCRPAVLRVSVVWQGFTSTVAPEVGCATQLYGDERLRRAIAVLVTTPLPGCA